MSKLLGLQASLNTCTYTRLHQYQNIKELNHRSKETDLEDRRTASVRLPVIPKSNGWQNNTPYIFTSFPNPISLDNIC